MNERGKINLVIEVRSLLVIVPESSRQRCGDLLHHPLVCFLCASGIAARSSTERNLFNGTNSFLVVKNKTKPSMLTTSISLGRKTGGTDCYSASKGVTACPSPLEVGCSMCVPPLSFFNGDTGTKFNFPHLNDLKAPEIFIDLFMVQMFRTAAQIYRYISPEGCH